MYLFVYGTLKNYHRNNYLLAQSIRIGEAVTVKKYSLYPFPEYDFPYLTKEKNYQIIGELYKINESTLKNVDHLESYPELYDREDIAVTVNGFNYIAICYFIKEAPEGQSVQASNHWGLDIPTP